MRIIVFAASGRVGQQVVRQAIEKGHNVTGVARDPARVCADISAPIAPLDLACATTADVAALVADADVVLSCLGARNRTDGGIASRGTRLILDGMTEAGTARLIVISAAPVAGMRGRAGADTGDDLLTRLVLAPLLRRILRRSYADLAEMETLVERSTAAWTIVRPPRLTEARYTGRYRMQVGRNLPGARSISRADLAHLLIRLPEMTETVGRPIAVGY